MSDQNAVVGIFKSHAEAETNVKGLSMSGTLMGCRYVRPEIGDGTRRYYVLRCGAD